MFQKLLEKYVVKFALTMWGEFVKWAYLKIQQAKRKKPQEKAQEKVEKEIKEKAPRTEEAKKNEEDWFNS